jgi:hypothetical protein
MSQAELFDLPAAGLRRARNGWIGHAGPFGRIMVWSHPGLPGISVNHCGHPTALRPYYLIGLPISRKFYSPEKAQAAAFNPDPFIKEEAEGESNAPSR